VSKSQLPFPTVSKAIEVARKFLSYLSLSELISEAMAFNVFKATGIPPPIRKNREPNMPRRM
jgi:hypothetical protein